MPTAQFEHIKTGSVAVVSLASAGCACAYVAREMEAWTRPRSSLRHANHLFGQCCSGTNFLDRVPHTPHHSCNTTAHKSRAYPRQLTVTYAWPLVECQIIIRRQAPYDIDIRRSVGIDALAAGCVSSAAGHDIGRCSRLSDDCSYGGGFIWRSGGRRRRLPCVVGHCGGVWKGGWC